MDWEGLLKVRCRSEIFTLKNLIDAIPHLKLLATGNQEVEIHCNHALKSLDKIEQAMENRSFTCLENVFCEVAEFDGQVINEVIDYFHSEPVTYGRNEAFSLAKKISLKVVELVQDLRELKKFF